MMEDYARAKETAAPSTFPAPYMDPYCMPPRPPAMHPEWQGSISDKWMDRNTGKSQSRNIVQTVCRNGDMRSLARMGMGEYFTDPAGVGAMNEGRRRIVQPPSDSHIWRPSKKRLDEPGHEHLEIPQGLKRVDRPEAGDIKKRNERLHIRQVSSKEEVSDRPQGVKIIFGENGLMAKDQTAQEVDLSQVMTRKRTCGSLLEQRNGFPCTTLGDKYYKHPEYSEGYWKAGELAVGSSFMRGSFPKTVARNSTAWKAFAAENPGAVKGVTYVEKRKAELEEEQRQDVAALTEATFKGGAWITSFEKKVLVDCSDAKFKDTLDMLEDDKTGDEDELDSPKKKTEGE